MSGNFGNNSSRVSASAHTVFFAWDAVDFEAPRMTKENTSRKPTKVYTRRNESNGRTECHERIID